MQKALPGGKALCRKRRKKEEVQMVMGEGPFGASELFRLLAVRSS
jgi:hypothetical protein